MRSVCFLVLVVIACECGASDIDKELLKKAKTKVWTSSCGRYTVEATLVRSSPLKIRLQRVDDNKIIIVKPEQLCVADRRFVSKHEWELDPYYSTTDWEKWEYMRKEKREERLRQQIDFAYKAGYAAGQRDMMHTVRSLVSTSDSLSNY